MIRKLTPRNARNGGGEGRRNHHSPESTAHEANAISSVCAYSLAPPLVLDWLAKIRLFINSISHRVNQFAQGTKENEVE